MDTIARGLALQAKTSGSKSTKLGKLRRAIGRAAISNPVDGAAASTLPTITTAFDATVGTFFLLDSLVNSGTKYFNLLGGKPYDQGSVSGAIHGWGAYSATNGGTLVAKIPTLEFWTDAPKVQVRGATGTWRVQVNGQYLSKTGNATGVGGGEQQLVFDWSGVRQPRLYRITNVGGAWFRASGWIP